MSVVRSMLAVALSVAAAVVFAQSSERINPAEVPSRTPLAINASTPLQVLAIGPLVNTRGGLITNVGTAPGGFDESRLQDSTLAMSAFGFSHSPTGVFRVAENFMVPPTGWRIDTITTYAYQTGSTAISTMTSLNFRIWNGPPGAPGSVVVFGDTTTNRMTSTAFSGIFRTLESAPGATNRPIMAVNASGLNLTLAGGVYWLDWSVGGSLGSGPWAPPLTVVGQTVTGDAVQFDGTTWATIVDVGSQGLPMTITGEALPPPVIPVNAAWMLLMLVALVSFSTFMMRRRRSNT